MRSIVYQFDDPRAFRSFILAGDKELALPLAETVSDGEWILAIFEIGKRKRATAAAARGVDHGEGDLAILFEDRDWARILAFSEAAENSLSGERAAAAVPLANDDDRKTPVKQATKSKLIPEPSDTQVSRYDDAVVTPSRPVHGMSDLRELVPRGSRGGINRNATSRVLLVEDDSEMARVVKTMLESTGLVVDHVDSGENAFDRAVSTSFDLVVLDWNLPGMNGVELCKKLRKEKSLSQMPILFLTGHAASSDVVEAFAAGADDFVSKPFRAPELNARILGLLRRARVSATSFDDQDEDE